MKLTRTSVLTAVLGIALAGGLIGCGRDTGTGNGAATNGSERQYGDQSRPGNGGMGQEGQRPSDQRQDGIMDPGYRGQQPDTQQPGSQQPRSTQPGTSGQR